MREDNPFSILHQYIEAIRMMQWSGGAIKSIVVDSETYRHLSYLIVRDYHMPGVYPDVTKAEKIHIRGVEMVDGGENEERAS